MFKKLLPALLLIGACGGPPTDQPPPAWIIGKYHYSGSGKVANKFPWDANSDLVLDHDGQYTMSIAIRVEDEKGSNYDHHDSYGSYYVDGEKLVLDPANEDDPDNTHDFTIHGRQLVLRMPWAARLALKGFKIPDPVFVKSE